MTLVNRFPARFGYDSIQIIKNAVRGGSSHFKKYKMELAAYIM